MRHSSKLSKTGPSAHSNAVNSGADQPAHHDHNNGPRRDTKTSAPLGGRKPGFFAQLFSSKSTIDSIEPRVGSSFVNLSRKSPSSSNTELTSIPPNLAIRGLSPELLNDPAFSTNPLSHLLFVTNPDSYSEPLPSNLLPNGNSQANMRESRTQDPRFKSPYYDNSESDSVSLNLPNRHSPPSEPSSLEGMGTNVSSSTQSSATEAMNEPSPASSYTDITTSSTSSTGGAGKLPKKNLIILEPPRILSPPPAYDESSHPRPTTIRHSSVPILPSSLFNQTEVLPHPMTTANDSRTVDLRRNNTDTNLTSRNRGLDPIDELDETSPLGLSLHHGGPYEAIKEVTQTPREPQNTFHEHSSQQTAQVSIRKTSNKMPFTNGPVAVIPFVPFGASLNLTPGQILPRNYQPYTQPPLHELNPPITQRDNQYTSIQQVPRPQHAPRNQQTSPPQSHPPQILIQLLPHMTSPSPPPISVQQIPYVQRNIPKISAPYPSQLGVRVQTSLTAEFPRRPSPLLSTPEPVEDDVNSIYGDESNAYDGIEDEETSDNAMPETLHHQEASTYPKVGPVQTHSNSVAAIRRDDASTLYAVAIERERQQRAQDFNPDNPLSKPFSGFSAFSEGPSTSDRLGASSRNVPALPPGASYRPPLGRYEQQARPLDHLGEQTPYTLYAPITTSHIQHYTPVNQLDGAWHRRATSLDPGFNPFVAQPPQSRPKDSGRQIAPASISQNSGQMHDMSANSNSTMQPPMMMPYTQPRKTAPPLPNLRDYERPTRSQQPAPSIQQSVNSTNSRTGLPPRHVPSKLTMPQPLYNPDATSTRNDLTIPPNRTQSYSQPPQHGAGLSRPMPVNQARPAMRSSPAPDSSRVQAQTIPMANDSRKVLRKRSSVQAASPGAASAMPTSVYDVPGRQAPRPSVNYPPTRSKSEMRPPATGNRMPPPSMPPDKKAPRRLLSKKRAEF
ncbi:hypothetical protein J3R30DRAFT_3697350 [Lentinula aciculospora]|uniref:Uncharacterized protein n=1 Tax=Lentinula aciculospora TaxID=153920 RepID=A0A9W9DUP2_9AGAR|nr:hypothetical protein J3R30DRAFT_3697350 [Lentinula aciculospora]